MQKVFIRRNIAHLSQASRTIFTTTPLVKLIGKNECTPVADSILEGSSNPPKHLLTPLQTAYFQNLQ